jgi:hypothetical protein
LATPVTPAIEKSKVKEWEEKYVRAHIKPEFVETLLGAAHLQDEFSEIAEHWKLSLPEQYSFDPAKYIKAQSLQKQVRQLAKQAPTFTPNVLMSALDDNIFTTLWPSIPLNHVCTTPTLRIALGVVALCAHLTTHSYDFHKLLAAAPERPNRCFHIVNALFATLKFTTKSSANVKARQVLLEKTLQFLESSLEHIPEIGLPPSSAPFPILAKFTHSLIDVLACTPRLTASYLCSGYNDRLASSEEDPTHKYGYRLQAVFEEVLHVDPNETEPLDEILADCEEDVFTQGGAEVDQVPLECNQGHSLVECDSDRGLPPPLLIFQATGKAGIPRKCIVPEVVLSDRLYYFAAAASLDMKDGHEDDFVLEVGLSASETAAVALVFYVREEQPFAPLLDENDEEPEEDEMDVVEEEVEFDSIDEV